MANGGDWKEFFAAAANGDLELVQYHLDTGVNPNYQHPEYMTTALIECAQLGQLAVIKLLLEQGADPTLKADADGKTALETAELYKQTAAAELLREAMAD